MRQRRVHARIVVDVAMAVLYVAVMATALVQEAPHEYLGIALFAAVVAHIVLNRRWFKALFRGRYDAVRALQLFATAGLLLCIIGQIASSLVLSKYAFGFLPSLPGAALARRAHMLCSYWGFVFAFAHAGLQFGGFERLVRLREESASGVVIWVARVALAAIACFGLYSFAQMDLGFYLLGQVQFATADYGAPIALSIARYASIAALIAVVFHCLRRAISNLGVTIK